MHFEHNRENLRIFLQNQTKTSLHVCIYLGSAAYANISKRLNYLRFDANSFRWSMGPKFEDGVRHKGGDKHQRPYEHGWNEMLEVPTDQPEVMEWPKKGSVSLEKLSQLNVTSFLHAVCEDVVEQRSHEEEHEHGGEEVVDHCHLSFLEEISAMGALTKFFVVYWSREDGQHYEVGEPANQAASNRCALQGMRVRSVP